MTITGRNLAILTALAYLVGWRLGWIELLVPAASGALALLLGLPAVLTRPRLEVERALGSARVTVGDSADAVLRVTNTGSRRAGPASRIEDRIAGEPIDLAVTGLAKGATRELTRPLPTNRRGVIEIGPAKAVKTDLLGLFRRQLVQAPVDRVWVHPRHVAVAGIPAGLSRDFEGPTSDTSPAGDVSFHALRDYEFGDDYRHIHWMSTARTGQLMVRHYVDNRLPAVHVVLDTDPERYQDDDGEPGRSAAFETAVEITASIGSSTLAARLPLSVQLGEKPVAPTDLMDELSLVDLSPGPLTVRPPADASVAVVVTGADVAPLSVPPGVHPVVIRVGKGALHPPLPRTLTFDVDSLNAFQLMWDREMTRRSRG